MTALYDPDGAPTGRYLLMPGHAISDKMLLRHGPRPAGWVWSCAPPGPVRDLLA